MQLYNLLLFIITLIGGSVPLWFKGINDRKMHLLLAFSGSFLLSIVFLHLLHETFEELHTAAGIYLLTGFFLQLVIQRFTHGIEHGHAHVESNDHGHHHHVPLTSILIGLGVHAFMEGLPLGFNYLQTSTEPSLYLAVAAHKLPEIMLASTLVYSLKGKKAALVTLVIFSLLTPLGSMVASEVSQKYYAISRIRAVVIPIVAGSFIHIATTIFFESGTRHHSLTWQKIIAIALGVGIGLLTLYIE
ncbi:MAG: ZIP family metal transporter [Flavipsychrobacter sp.]|nr:ZIP family metal transporter [Flavipsychrobacter sp.]